jgi:hypothetical protein
MGVAFSDQYLSIPFKVCIRPKERLPQHAALVKPGACRVFFALDVQVVEPRKD